MSVNDFDLLLVATTPVEADLAESLLKEHNIPSYVHNKDFDMAELGIAAHNAIRRPDFYVPKGMRERALEVLREAWGDEAFEQQGIELAPAAASATATERSWWWLILLVFVVVAVFLAVWI